MHRGRIVVATVGISQTLARGSTYDFAAGFADPISETPRLPLAGASASSPSGQSSMPHAPQRPPSRGPTSFVASAAGRKSPSAAGRSAPEAPFPTDRPCAARLGCACCQYPASRGEDGAGTDGRRNRRETHHDPCAGGFRRHARGRPPRRRDAGHDRRACPPGRHHRRARQALPRVHHRPRRGPGAAELPRLSRSRSAPRSTTSSATASPATGSWRRATSSTST